MSKTRRTIGKKYRYKHLLPWTDAEMRLVSAIFGEGSITNPMGYLEGQVPDLDELLENEVDYVPVHKPVDYNSWAKRGDRYYSVDVTHKQLPADVYVVKKDNNAVP